VGLRIHKVHLPNQARDVAGSAKIVRDGLMLYRPWRRIRPSLMIVSIKPGQE